MMDLGVDPYMVNYALRGILAQRLVRRVCDHCNSSYTPTDSERTAYEKETGKPVGLAQAGSGCDWCRKTGFSGRSGIFELLEISETVRKAVTEGVDEAEFRQRLVGSGFKTMSEEGALLVEQGITSLPEFLRTTYDAR